MPGHNAFQRNAFQRNAFQIVYNFAPVVSGGIVLGGSTTSSFRSRHHPFVTGGLVLGGAITSRFRSSHNPVVTGGIVLGGSVTCSFHAAGTHRAIVTGGIVIGGSVRARFRPGVVIRSGGGGRTLRDLFRRKHHYKPKIIGGLVIGGAVYTELYVQEPPEPEPIPEPKTFEPIIGGSLVLGGSVLSSFYQAPPAPIILIPEEDSPSPVHFKARIGDRQPILLGEGIKARFNSNPPPPPRFRIPIFSKAKQLRHQIQEEDELLLLGFFDD